MLYSFVSFHKFSSTNELRLILAEAGNLWLLTKKKKVVSGTPLFIP